MGKRSLAKRPTGPHARTVRAHYQLYREQAEGRGQNPLPLDLWAITALRTSRGNSKLMEALKEYTRPLRKRMAARAAAELELKAQEAGTRPLLKATPATDEDLERDPTSLVVFEPLPGADEKMLEALNAASDKILKATRRAPGYPIHHDPQGLTGRKVAMLRTAEHPDGAVYDLETMTPVEDPDARPALEQLDNGVKLDL